MEFYNNDSVVKLDHVKKILCIGYVTPKKAAPRRTDSLSESTSNPYDILNDITDNNSLDGDVSSDEEEYNSAPQSGQVRVTWLMQGDGDPAWTLDNRNPRVDVNASELILQGRRFKLSEMVLRQGFPDLVGIVNELSVTADVELVGLNKLMLNVDCSLLRQMEESPVYQDRRIVYESWLGKILEINVSAIVRFNDGAKLLIDQEDLEELTQESDVLSSWNGSVIEGCVLTGPSSYLRTGTAKFLIETDRHNANWLRNSGEEQMSCIVEKTLQAEMEVQWLINRSNNSASPPPTRLKHADLDRVYYLDPYPWHSIQFGDVWYYQLREGDVILNKEPNQLTENALYELMTQGENHSLSKTTVSQASEEASAMNADPTQVNRNSSEGTRDVSHKYSSMVYPPGSVSRKRTPASSKCTSLRRSQSLDHNRSNNQAPRPDSADVAAERIPEEAQSEMSMENELPLRVGQWVPVVVLLTRRTADVCWQTGAVSRGVDCTQLVEERYTIDDHDFFPGDFVSNKLDGAVCLDYGSVLSCVRDERVCTVQWFKVSPTAPSQVVKSGNPVEVGVYDITGHRYAALGDTALMTSDSMHNRFPAGYVIGVCPTEGQLLMWWPDGSNSRVFPTQVILSMDELDEVNDDTDDDYEDSQDFEEEEDTEWETESEWEVASDDEECKEGVQKCCKELRKGLKKLREMRRASTSMDYMRGCCQEFVTLETLSELGVQVSCVNIYRDMNLLKSALENAYSQLNDWRIRKQMAGMKLRQIFCAKEFASLELSHKIRTRESEQPSPCGEESQETSQQDEGKSPTTTEEACSSSPPKVEDPFADIMNKICRKVTACLDRIESFIILWITEKGLDLPADEVSTSPELEKCGEENGFPDTNGTVGVGQTTSSMTSHQKETQAISKLDDLLKAPLFNDPVLGLERTNDVQGATSEVRTNDVQGATGEVQGVEEESSKKAPISGESSGISGATSLTSPTIDEIPAEQRGQFIMIEEAPRSHKFYSSNKPSMTSSQFMKAWKRDMKLLSTSLPSGVLVKGFEDRLDLFSLLIVGVSGTPYEHALFFFDLHLPSNYPSEPPKVHYLSLAPERVNPNLYTEGKVCLSLLGTWTGRGTENWDAKDSTLLQVVVSLQGLILNSEPYFNEAGYEARRKEEGARENSKKYNESVVINLSQSMAQLLRRPVEVFREEIDKHFRGFGQRYVNLLRSWLELTHECPSETRFPEFPLYPVSRGFQISLRRNLDQFEQTLAETMTADSAGAQ